MLHFSALAIFLARDRCGLLVGHSATTPVGLVGSSDLQRVCDLQQVFYIALLH